MANVAEKLNALLAYKDAHAPWFSLNEHQPYALKRNLKLLGKLNNSPSLLPNELDELTEKKITDVFSAYVKQANKKPALASAPSTASQFFHTMMSQSPYFCDVIAYSEPSQNNSPKALGITLSASNSPELSTPAPTAEQIHGFTLHKGEAFSSTRYFSDDKKSFAKIIAQNGVFQATHHNLNQEQKADLALEMGYQFLLNLPPDKKDVRLTGSPEEVLRVHAALVYLQKEAGARFSHVTFHLPAEVSLTPNERTEDYITKHLGTFPNPPRQVVQWRDFLKMELKSPKNSDETPAPLPPKKERPPLIDMERVFHAEDLSQQDKINLNEYQRFLQERWVGENSPLLKHKGGAGDDKQLIAFYAEFSERTELALQLLNKAPSLKNEYGALSTLYQGAMENCQKHLNSLHQIGLEFETQMKGIMVQEHKTEKVVLDDCVRLLSECIITEMSSNPDLSHALKQELTSHAQTITEIASFIVNKESLSDDMLRAFGAQLVPVFNALESIKDFSKEPHFSQFKEFAQKISNRQNTAEKVGNEQLLYASNQLKERLNQFKSKLDSPAEPKIPLNSELTKQINALIKEINELLEDLDEGDNKPILGDLHAQLGKIEKRGTLSVAEHEALIKKVDAVLPHIKDNPTLIKACTELKKLISPPSIPNPNPNEANKPPSMNK